MKILVLSILVVLSGCSAAITCSGKYHVFKSLSERGSDVIAACPSGMSNPTLNPASMLVQIDVHDELTGDNFTFTGTPETYEYRPFDTIEKAREWLLK